MLAMIVSTMTKPRTSMSSARARVPKLAFAMRVVVPFAVVIVRFFSATLATADRTSTSFSLLLARAGEQASRCTTSAEGGRCMLTFIREDEGQGLVEYALIIAVIAIAVIVAMVFLRGQIQNIFSNIGNNRSEEHTS